MATTQLANRIRLASRAEKLGKATADDQMFIQLATYEKVMEHIEMNGRTGGNPMLRKLENMMRANESNNLLISLFFAYFTLIDECVADINRAPSENPDLIGKMIMKEFDAGMFKGKVKFHDASGYFVEYDDDDSEHMSESEVIKFLYEPSDSSVSLMDRIEWIEGSGNKALSFSKMCKEIVNGRPSMTVELTKIYKKMFDIDIGVIGVHDIGPWLWPLLGGYEIEKLYNGKRVIEALQFASLS